jgi:GNAT superfamily N-acetyltransferase
MLTELDPHDGQRVTDLFDGFDWHLAVDATLGGAVQGKILVDDPQRPTAALLGANHRFFVTGCADNAAFVRDLVEYFDETIYPVGRAAGASAFTLTYKSQDWQRAVEAAFADKYLLADTRFYLECSGTDLDWRAMIPPDCSVEPVTADLLQRRGLGNMSALVEEMQSERASVEEFLAASFGFCMLCGDQITGWCLSEYNTGQRCEVGIETAEGYRRQGIATILTAALLEQAFEQGMQRVGWHCWTRNRPSLATALKAGFREVGSYSLYLSWFDEAMNFAVNGNVCLWDGHPLEALAWYQRALANGELPAWVWWNAASAAARLLNVDLALAYLDQAVRHGFPNPQHVVESDDWAGLRQSSRWPEVLRISDAR